MFQFATGYTVAKKNNVDLSLDLRWFRRRKLHNGFELQKVFDIYSLFLHITFFTGSY